MTAKPGASSGGFGLLDFVALIAMAVVAVAFACGLILNSGIDTMAGAIAGAALFMVMASSHIVLTRSLRAASVSGRLDEMEDAIVALDTDLQRIDQVEDDVARLDLLNDRVERLDNALAEFEGGSELAGSARFERLSAELERLQERIEALRSEFDVEPAAALDAPAPPVPEGTTLAGRARELPCPDPELHVERLPVLGAGLGGHTVEGGVEVPRLQVFLQGRLRVLDDGGPFPDFPHQWAVERGEEDPHPPRVRRRPCLDDPHRRPSPDRRTVARRFSIRRQRPMPCERRQSRGRSNSPDHNPRRPALASRSSLSKAP